MQIPRLREWREARALTQEELAEQAGVSVRSVAGYEAGSGARPGTVRRLAVALDIEVGDLLGAPPKVSAPPSLEPSFNDVLEEERRVEVLDAQLDYVKRRAKTLDLDLQDQNSPHFRDATAAASWLAMVRTEAKNWTDWVIEHAQLFTSLGGGLYDPSLWRSGFKLAAGLAEYQRLIRIAESRLAAMSDKPSEFMKRISEKTQQELEESTQRLPKELQAANG